jgi:hypothetical protein
MSFGYLILDFNLYIYQYNIFLFFKEKGYEFLKFRNLLCQDVYAFYFIFLPLAVMNQSIFMFRETANM